MKAFKQFLFGETNGVKWWQFWNPNSGFVGGIILMCLVAALLKLFLF